ncbi:LOW QUALITY PROTEIN: hypothetical protein CVT26_007551, partial [Gymnopilus dilepis]
MFLRLTIVYQTPFKPGWGEDGPPITPLNPHFDVGDLLRELSTMDSPPSSPLEALSATYNPDSSLDFDVFSLSPLTSPEATPKMKSQPHGFETVPSISWTDVGNQNVEDIDPAVSMFLPSPNMPISSPLHSNLDQMTNAQLSDEAVPVKAEVESNPPPQLSSHKKRQRALNHQRRNLKRQHEREEIFSHHEACLNAKKDSAPSIQIDLETEKCSRLAAAFVGMNDTSGSRKPLKVEELVGEKSKYKFGYVPWNGSTRRAFLAGQPDEDQWPQLMREAAEALESGRSRRSIPRSELVHWQGAFPAIRCGVSHGGGLTCPGNLRNNKENTEVVEELCKMNCFRQLAGFATSVMASKAPKLYQYNIEHLTTLHERHPELKHLFPSSVFAAASFNFGPCTTCRKHKDFQTYLLGSVTALGNFDPRAGGHLVLWECKLVIEFPPGSTILLPSAIIAHSNTAVQKHERRYLFAQYTAGGLFRWVENDCKLSTEYYASLSPEELE